MAMNFGGAGYLQNPGSPYVALLMNQPNINNGTLAGTIGTALQGVLKGLILRNDMQQQSAASQALVKGMQPQQLPADQYGPPNPGGITGAVSALNGLGDNPYAGRLAQDLLLRQAENQQNLQTAKELKMAPGYHEPIPGRDVPYSPEVLAQLRDLKTMTGLTDAPSQVKIFKFIQSLPPDQQAMMWNIIRGTKTVDTGGGVMVVPPWGMPGAGGTPPAGMPQTMPNAPAGQPPAGPIPNAAPGAPPVAPGGQPGPVVGPGGVTMIPKTVPPQDTPQNKGAVAGAEADAKKSAERRWEEAPAYSSAVASVAPLDRMANTVDEILTSPGLGARTGYTSDVPPWLQGQDARNMQAKMDTLKSQVAQNVLQMYRQMSQTGGAVGQVSNFEQQMFQNNLAALNQAQSEEEFKKQLGLIRQFVQDSKRRIMEAYRRTYEQQPGQAAPSGGNIIRYDAQGNRIQ